MRALCTPYGKLYANKLVLQLKIFGIIFVFELPCTVHQRFPKPTSQLYDILHVVLD